jgi:hypothetical protein
MNARELLAHFDFSFIKSDGARATILRALALLAAVDESSDGLVRELDEDAAQQYAWSNEETANIERKAAARIVALEQELASVKAHEEVMESLLREWLVTEIDPEDEEYQSWMEQFMQRVIACIPPRAAHPRTP